MYAHENYISEYIYDFCLHHEIFKKAEYRNSSETNSKKGRDHRKEQNKELLPGRLRVTWLQPLGSCAHCDRGWGL